MIVYDNMNFKQIVRDEIVDHRDFMIAVITAALVKSLNISSTDLNQSMQNIIETLSIHDIIETSDVDEENQSRDEQIFMFLIFNAIQKVHSTVVDSIFKNTDLLSRMLVVHALSVRRTQYQQLETILKDEEIIAETMRVHEKIFLKQLDFIKNDEIFSHRLFSVYENALIIKLTRNVKLKQFKSSQLFQRRE